MNELNFQTSKKVYTVNGGAQIAFDPADINFANRLYGLMNELEAMEKEEAPQDPLEVFKVAVERDKVMRAKIDAVFEEPVCDKIFGTTNVFSPAGGMPVCMNFLMAVIDEIDEVVGTETKTSPQMEAYMRKYEAKYGKYVKK